MKRVSNSTLKKRILENRCPFCGCSKRDTIDYIVEYPERHIEIHCSYCGKLLAYTDNSPWFDLNEMLRENKCRNYKTFYKILEIF